jgi:hypothetical protein
VHKIKQKVADKKTALQHDKAKKAMRAYDQVPFLHIQAHCGRIEGAG